MGNYVFSTEALVEAVTTDAGDETSNHDIGRQPDSDAGEARRGAGV